VVLLEHPLDYWEGQKLRQRLQENLAPLFAPLRLHLLLLEEENAPVQYAAIRGIQVYAVNEEFARKYRRQLLTLYGDWHSWWPGERVGPRPQVDTGIDRYYVKINKNKRRTRRLTPSGNFAMGETY